MKKVIRFVSLPVMCLIILSALNTTTLVFALPIGGSVPSNPPAGGSPTAPNKLVNPLKNNVNDVFALVSMAVDIALTFASIFAVLYLVWLGFQYVLARGSPDKISELHGTFMWGIIGIAVIFSAKVLSVVLQNTINAVAK
ncbi:MAG: hypothetical protein Q7R78_01575 [bacterium]|nr:hypothetical protein [bacterium]